MSKITITFDTDHIKEYVFAASTLKEIRGASGLLDEINRKKMLATVKEIDSSAERIYANGGQGMFKADPNKVDEIIAAVKALYQSETITASITGVAHHFEQGSFNDNLKALGYKLRLAKSMKGGFANLVTHPLLRPCDRCREEYATQNDPDEAKKVICQSCLIQRTRGEKSTDQADAIFAGEMNPDGQDVQKTIWEWLAPALCGADNSFVGAKLPKDFNALGNLSNGYMALIYADGNNMGERFLQCSSESELKKLSEQVVDLGMRTAVLEAVKANLKPVNKQLPFDILMLGGDDLIMVTTSDKAIETAKMISEEYWKHTNEQDDPLSVSIGVVIAHAKFPFGSLVKLAESTLKFAKKEDAKRKLKNSKHNSKGLINFLVVNAGADVDFGHVFNKSYKHEDEWKEQKRKFIRTLRPYDADELDELIKLIRKFKGYSFPKNKLQALREATFFSESESLLEGLAIQSRLKDEQRKLVWEALKLKSNANACKKLADFEFTDGADCQMAPWAKKNGVRYSPFVDMAELYNFISGGA